MRFDAGGVVVLVIARLGERVGHDLVEPVAAEIVRYSVHHRALSGLGLWERVEWTSSLIST
jgi:hypothetical protein